MWFYPKENGEPLKKRNPFFSPFFKLYFQIPSTPLLLPPLRNVVDIEYLFDIHTECIAQRNIRKSLFIVAVATNCLPRDGGILTPPRHPSRKLKEDDDQKNVPPDLYLNIFFFAWWWGLLSSEELIDNFPRVPLCWLRINW